MVNIERDYAPGACNISREEGALRLATGFIGTGLTLAVVLAFLAMGVPRLWRLAVFLPAMMAATGYLQASLKFCVNYGLRGVYNTAGELGVTTKTEGEAKVADRRRSLVILGWSAAISAAVTLAFTLI